MVASHDIDALLRPLLLQDLRIQCRGRGINPGGNKDTLIERLKEYMLETGDVSLIKEGGSSLSMPTGPGGSKEPVHEEKGNNYVRPEGQNVGNFITDRPSSRVLAPPGGKTSIFMGE